MSHEVTFDRINLVMSETGVPKKFRLNNFLKKISLCSKTPRKMVRVKEREGGGEESFLPSPPSPPSFILWLSFHFSGGQTRPFFAPKPNPPPPP